MIDPQTKAYIDSAIKEAERKALYSIKNASFHIHNGIDSPLITFPSSINGLATGTAVTSIPSLTQTILEPTNSFTNGITFNSTGSDYGFTVLTAGQYLITGTVEYTSSQTGYLYQTRILQTPRGGSQNEISTVISIGNSGASVSALASIVYNLGVGDLIQLATYCSYSSGGTVSNNGTLTYFCIAKI
jgi:hypothetical protein